MSNHQFVIRVKGNIKIKEGIHYTQGCGAFGIGSLEQCSEMDMLIGTGHLVKSDQFVFNENEQSVDSDLIVDRNTRLIPYAYYVADKGFMDHSVFSSVMAAIIPMAASAVLSRMSWILSGYSLLSK